MMIYVEELKKNKTIIQVHTTKAIHAHGQLKIKNKYKKIFFGNYYYLRIILSL